MPSLRFPIGGAPASALIVLFALQAVATPAIASDEAEVLAQAVRLFDDGEYVAAQEMLAGVDRSKLTGELQGVRDDYLSRCQIAVTLYEKALRDLEDAETAIAERELDRAEQLLFQVISNEYAAEALRRAANAHLRDLKERAAQPVEPGQVESPTRTEILQAGMGEVATEPESVSVPAEVPAQEQPSQPTSGVTHDDVDRARALCAQGDELVRAARYDEAEQLYHQALTVAPGYPPAVEGLTRVGQHRENIAGYRGQSLIERIRREDAINWQRTVAQFRDAARAIRDHVANERFDEGNLLLVRARQIVESGKQFADPITKYENLRSELDALATHVRQEEREFHERKVAKIRLEIEEQRSRRLREISENRARQMDMLMKQALQHRKEGDLDAAINVLKQAVVVDPKHAPARWLMDILEDQRHYRRARESRDSYYRESRSALEEVEEAKIPWHQEVKYPDDWLELITRGGRGRPEQSRQDQLISSALDRPIPVDFNREPFEQVMERLAEANRLNFIVNWHDLKRAGVEPTTVVDLSLPREITLKKALTEVLEQVGGGAHLGYEVGDGVITVATQEFLDRKTYPMVYDITDLLMEIPAFNDAPMIDLRDANTPKRKVSADADRPWQYGDDDDDEPEEDPQRMTRVRRIIDLLEDTVNPQSWHGNGGSIGTIKEINGQLVITQNSSGHRQIIGLLSKLREERAIQISVEALFLTVSSHYLEELGMDLDIVLNSGNAGFDFVNSGQGPLTDPVLGNRALLPRTFTRLGYAQSVPANVGAALTPGPAMAQPFNSVSLVPQATGGIGSEGTPVPITSRILDFTNAENLPSDVPGSFAGQTIGPALSLFGSFLDNIQVDFLIRATQADSRTSVLTAPRIVVFNGGSAWVAVTIQQNFVSQLQPVVAQAAVGQAPTIGTIDAGASLFVRATVTADRRYVMMLLAPGVTRLLALQTFQFSGGTGAFPAFLQLPTLSSQRLQTVVSVPDGGTLLVGGQKLANEAEIEAGVPILSKIPILKRLYSSRSMVKDEQTLLILIKPRVLIQSEQEELAFPAFKQG